MQPLDLFLTRVAGQRLERRGLSLVFPLPRINQRLRITIGTDTQSQVLVDALRQILQQARFST